MARRQICILCVLAVLLGTLQAVTFRHWTEGDGISYLDIADSFSHGHWAALVNGYWSPLYPFLIGLVFTAIRPSAYWELTAVHALNIGIFLAALACFHFFLAQLLHRQRGLSGKALPAGWAPLSESSLHLVCYSIFLWSSLQLIKISNVTPDMCVAAAVYATCGLLLRIAAEPEQMRGFCWLGLALGVGYWAKAVLFPLAFLFLAVAFFCAGARSRAAAGTLLSLAIFVAMASPEIVALSLSKGRFTFGDSGRLNYAWRVNGTPIADFHWQGQPPGTGTPVHATRRLTAAPAVYEFATPVGGTYPPWTDPSYWYEGVKLHFDLNELLGAAAFGIRGYYVLLLRDRLDLLAVAVVLFFIGGEPWFSLRAIPAQWMLLIPSAAALLLYLPVVRGLRYVAPFAVIAGFALFASVRLPDTDEFAKGAAVGITLVCALLLARLAGSELQGFVQHANMRADWNNRLSREDWQIAEALHRMGVKKGDQVGALGNRFSPFWARLARLRIVAEMPYTDVPLFWDSTPEAKARVYSAFAASGAKAIVTEEPAEESQGWQRIGSTSRYVLFLSRPGIRQPN